MVYSGAEDGKEAGQETSQPPPTRVNGRPSFTPVASEATSDDETDPPQCAVDIDWEYICHKANGLWV